MFNFKQAEANLTFWAEFCKTKEHVYLNIQVECLPNCRLDYKLGPCVTIQEPLGKHQFITVMMIHFCVAGSSLDDWNLLFAVFIYNEFYSWSIPKN